MKKVGLIIIALLVCPVLCYAIDLDAPVKKKITVKSEIERGQSTIRTSVGKLYGDNILGQLSAINNAINQNVQQNTDTKPFLLGAYLEAWSHIDIVLTALEKTESKYKNSPAIVSKQEINLAKTSSKAYFDYWRKIQKELKIKDEALMDPDYLKKKIADWEKRIGAN